MTSEGAPQVAIGDEDVIIAFRKVDDLMIFLSSEVYVRFGIEIG